MKYEIICGKPKKNAKKFLKKSKSKSIRLASKKIALMHFLGRESRALGINDNPKKGWSL